ncbi:MAG: TIGR04255 family protein [Gammaproteobacteria bacterium]|nr:TIGR04255 family protein [Gammaproteobacteria bacterium]
MNDSLLALTSSPIVEAVLDIDCDMPPATNLAALEPTATRVFGDQYPTAKTQIAQETQIESRGQEFPRVTTTHGLAALQFFSDDDKQLVQLRLQGYSFNRLTPYSSLDDYLPEIERTWRLFLTLAAPIKVSRIRLRYINRLLLPLTEGKVGLDEFLRLGPRLPDDATLVFSSFFNQHVLSEPVTGNVVKVIMASQLPENHALPLILDIEAERPCAIEPNDWTKIAQRIDSLRALKNLVFRKSLTEPCLNRYRQ